MKLEELQSESTPRLILLTIVTYGVYPVYYLRRLTNGARPELPLNQRISPRWISVNFVFAYLSLALLVPYWIVPYWIVDEGHPLQLISNVVDGVSNLLLLFWSFKVRNWLNSLLAATPGKVTWFHGFWTFLLQFTYINYKINALREVCPEQNIGQIPSETADEPSM